MDEIEEDITLPYLYLKLKTGDEIVSEATFVDSETEGDHYILRRPLKVVYAPSPTGGISAAMIPWIVPEIVANDTFIVYATDIITISEVRQKIANRYVILSRRIYEEDEANFEPTHPSYVEEPDEDDGDDEEKDDHESSGVLRAFHKAKANFEKEIAKDDKEIEIIQKMIEKPDPGEDAIQEIEDLFASFWHRRPTFH